MFPTPTARPAGSRIGSVFSFKLWCALLLMGSATTGFAQITRLLELAQPLNNTDANKAADGVPK